MKRPLAIMLLPLLLAAACVGELGAPGAADDDGAGGGDDVGPGGPGPGPGTPPPTDKVIVAYFAAWGVYGRDYHVAEIPAAEITHINYAFVNISPDGECVLGDAYADIDKFYPGDSWDAGALRGSFHQLQLLKQQHPQLRVLLSVGGWSWSGRFSDVALTDASRRRFAASCVDMVESYGFDGLDIDWEYPGGGGLESNVSRPEDRENFTALLAALRAELDARAPAGSHWQLTIAAPANLARIAFIDAAAIHPLCDFINVMTYDFHGAWEARTGLNAPLYASPGAQDPDYNVDSALGAWLAAGVPAAKLVMGVPFYGRGWAGVPATNDGLWQPASGASPGTWEAGVLDWHDLRANYLPRLAPRRSAEARVPWLYDAAAGIMISYDDPASLAEKAAYVKQHGLGGVMFWELSGDDAEHSLLRALRSAL